MRHLAFVHRNIAAEIAAGRKTCESRLSKNTHPARRVQVGDEIYFKISGGDCVAVGVAERVEHYDGLRADDVDCLREMYAGAVNGALNLADYWSEKSGARFATFIWLKNLSSVHIPAAKLPSSRMAWISDFTPPA